MPIFALSMNDGAVPERRHKELKAMVKKETEEKVNEAIRLYCEATNAMIKAIEAALDEIGEISFGVLVNRQFNVWEDWTACKIYEDDSYIIVDENDDKVSSLDEATSDMLFTICGELQY